MSYKHFYKQFFRVEYLKSYLIIDNNCNMSNLKIFITLNECKGFSIIYRL